jgi:hypothetical protein
VLFTDPGAPTRIRDELRDSNDAPAVPILTTV